ncbi:hypothetical protein G6F31_020338 [Rhizopus arrhizus]|nr:hypothetical protein G6F31_020338 [Rhizopus arrhizus]
MGARLAMGGRQVGVHVGGKAVGGRSSVHALLGAGQRLVEHVFDRGLDQRVLRIEMGVEAAVRHAGLAHHSSHADPVGPVGTHRFRRRLQNAYPRFPFVSVVVAHDRPSH